MPTARLLITGSRNFGSQGSSDIALMRTALKDARCRLAGVGFDRIILVHGAARGADQLAASIGKSMGFTLEPHPAQWDVHGKTAGPIRNKEMVELGADLVLAFPRGSSRGTRGCMALADKAGIEVINVTEGK